MRDQTGNFTSEDLRWVGFLSGAFAGVNRVMVGHPFDTLKVRVQTGERLIAERSFKGFLSLYRGIVPPLFSIGCTTSINFGLYENTRLSILSRFGPNPSLGQSLRAEYIAGTAAGSLQTFVTMPLENAKVIQQTSSHDHSMWRWLSTLYRMNGISSLYRGLAPCIVQSGFGRGFYLGAYFLMKRFEDGKLFESHTSPLTFASSDTLLGKILAAAVAGVAGWSFTYPFDVVRNNMMRDYRHERYSSTLNCIRTLIKIGGIRQLYAGFMFTLVRAVPVACVSLPSYDVARHTFVYMLDKRRADAAY